MSKKSINWFGKRINDWRLANQSTNYLYHALIKLGT